MVINAMTRKATYPSLVCAVVLACGVPAVANAKQVMLGVKDMYRYHEKHEGLRSGSFIYTPSVAATESYEDNIFRTSTNEESDFITEVSPELKVDSDFALHSLSFDAKGLLGFYNQNSNENYKDYTLSARGQLDVDYETYFYAQTQYQAKHQDRDFLENPNTDKPIELSLAQAKAGYSRKLNLVNVRLEGELDRAIYEDSTRSGALVNNSGLNFDERKVSARLGYEPTDGNELYTQLGYQTKDYNESGSYTGLSYHGYDAVLGVNKQLDDTVMIGAFGGATNRQYENSVLDTTDITFGGQTLWNITERTSFAAGLKRDVGSAIYRVFQGNRTSTRYFTELQHSLSEHTLLVGNAGYSEDDFAFSTGLNRSDKNYTSDITLSHKLRENTELSLGYGYARRESNLANEGYTNNRAMLTLRVMY